MSLPIMFRLNWCHGCREATIVPVGGMVYRPKLLKIKNQSKKWLLVQTNHHLVVGGQMTTIWPTTIWWSNVVGDTDQHT